MKKKTKLAFEELEKELSLMSLSQMFNVLGGFSFGSGNDCVIYAIAFATGKSYEDVNESFGDFYAKKNNISGIDGSKEIGKLIASNSGIDFGLATEFANSMGLYSNSGVSGDADLSTSGNMSVVFLDNGNGNGHAIVVTAHDGKSGFYYHDPQNGTNGMLANNDPRIAGFFN